MNIKTLEHTDFEILFHSFQKAFYDYKISFEKEELRSILTRRGYDPRLSFAAFDNGEIVAFTLNGIGMFNDIPTAYDTGTGTLKEYRGRGLAGEIFSYSLPYLKEAGIRQYLLEVLCDNERAISVYRQMNFEISRRFDCFRQDVKEINISSDIVLPGEIAIRQVEHTEIIPLQYFADFNPSWQNSIQSITRGSASLVCLGAMVKDKLIGYCVVDPSTGDLTQLAVDPLFRRKGVGSCLLREAIGLLKTPTIKVLNVASDCLTLPTFLDSKNISLSSQQYEMILRL